MKDSSFIQRWIGWPVSRLNAFVDWCVPDDLASADASACRRARLVAAFAAATALVGAPYALIYLRYGSPAAAAVVGAGVAITPLVVLSLRWKRSHVLAGNLGAAVLFLVLTPLALVMGGAESSALAWYPIVSVLAVCMAGRRSGLAWTGVMLAALAAFGILHWRDFGFASDIAPGTRPFIALMTFGGATVLSYMLTGLLDTQSTRTLNDVQCSEHRFRMVAECASDLIYEWDCASGHVEWFGDIDGALGYEQGAFSRTLDAWLAAIHPDDRPRLEAAFAHHRQSVTHIEDEYRIRRADGTWRWWTGRGIAVIDDKGIPRSWIGTCTDITERKRAEAKLLESEERYRLLFEGSRDAFTTLAPPSWRYTSGNPAIVEMFRAGSQEEFTSHAPWDLSPERQPDGRPSAEKAREMIDIALREGSHFFEWTHRRLDGELFPTSLFLTRMELGGRTILQATIRDITAQKRAEEELRKLSQAVEQSPAIVMITDPRGTIEYVNPRFTQVYGFTAQEAIGKDPRILRSGQTPPETYAQLWNTITSGQQWRGELLNRDKSGTLIWELASISPVTDRAGRITHFVGVKEVITERKRVEESLRTSERKLSNAMKIARLGYWEYDVSENLFTFDDHFYSLFRTTAEEVGGYQMSPDEYASRFLHPEDALLVAEETRKAMETPDPNYSRHLEHRIRYADGETGYIAAQFFIVKDKAGRTIKTFGANQDITERKRAEQELLRANARLEEQSARAEMASAAKSEFLANMSHEIRTPMTAILGFADTLLEPGISASERVNAIHTIRRNGEHLLQVINDILDISKIEAGRLAVERIECSPIQLVADVHSLMSVRAQAKKLPFHIEYAGPVPLTIRSDPTRVRQILVNLVGNAIKFTETGAVRLVVRFEAHDGSDARGQAEPMIQFDVIDTGIGMTPEQMRNLFRPFSQGDASTTRKFGGTGLGLLISQRLARMLGGEVSVESIPGRGSRFRAKIATGPLDDVTFVEASAHMDCGESPVTRGAPATGPALDCRVLLAEDGPDNQRLISHILEKAGAEVTVVENGQLAVEAGMAACRQADGHNPAGTFDVILMDMQMPVMDGYEATSLLRQKGYRGAIIALTAHAMESDRQKCLDAGCDDYASKPINRTRLIEVIRQNLSNEPGVEPMDESESSEALVSELSSDPDLADLVEVFVDELPARIEALERACGQEDLDTLTRLSHQLKGSAGGYGFPTITEAAANLEQLARAQGTLVELTAALRDLADLCRRAQVGIACATAKQRP